MSDEAPRAKTTVIEPKKDAPTELRYDRFELSVREGPDRGAKQVFGQKETQIGTARANDFVLGDRTVSRFHAKIENDAGSFLIHDLGSTNGIYVGPLRVRVAHLDAETTLRFGNTQVSFKPLGETTTVDLPDQDHLGDIVGRSVAMRQLYQLIDRVAESTVPVVIEGETGTGKDLAARAVHARSDRADKPFEVLDCAAIPENLMESELFGHVRGAFTGAERDRAGIFERANHGTVFLDEMGELPLHLQPKLLRVLENGEVRRVGDSKTTRVDVRIVAATFRSLRDLVNQGEFREDLYYRLAGCKLYVPPLRDRPQDIPLLVNHFLKRVRVPEHRQVPEAIDEATMTSFLSYPWPGNVRQLRNAVERVAVMGSLELSQPHIEQPKNRADDSFVHMTLKDARDAFDRRYLEALLKRFDGDTAAAADAADVHPKTLRRMLQRQATDDM